MHIGYRAIIFPMGLVLTGVGEPSPFAVSPANRPTAENLQVPASVTLPPSIEGRKAVEPSDYFEPCGRAKDKGSSDLCAQWRAANAAREAADWAWWQLWLSGLGALGLGATLFFNFRAFRLAEREARETRDALEIAARNADATSEQVKLSGDVARRELRAYVTTVSANVEIWREGGLALTRFEYVLHNSGKTTAIFLQRKSRFQNKDAKGNSINNRESIINPGGYEKFVLQCSAGNVDDGINIVGRMFIKYRDYLDEVHTEDSVWFTGPEFDAPLEKNTYKLTCDTKINESIGTFIDEKGEDEERRQIEETLQKFKASQDSAPH